MPRGMLGSWLRWRLQCSDCEVKQDSSGLTLAKKLVLLEIRCGNHCTELGKQLQSTSGEMDMPR